MPENQPRKYALTPEMEKAKWKPGQSGNPAGRKKKGDALADLLNMILAEKASEKLTKKVMTVFPDVSKASIREIILRAVCIEAINGNMAAVNYISERTEGKVRESESPDSQMDLTKFAEAMRNADTTR